MDNSVSDTTSAYLGQLTSASAGLVLMLARRRVLSPIGVRAVIEDIAPGAAPLHRKFTAKALLLRKPKRKPAAAGPVRAARKTAAP